MRVFKLVKQTGAAFLDDDCPRMAAALAFYMLFSLPPLLAIVISVAGIAFDQADVQRELMLLISSVFGERGAGQIEQILQHADESESGLWSGIVGGIVLLVGATTVLNELQEALNRAWSVEPDPKQGGVRNFVLKRIISFGMLLGIAFLLMVSLVVNAILSLLGNRIGMLLPDDFLASLIQAGHSVVSFGVITLLFALIYKILPDAEVRWRDVWLAAVVTSLLFGLGRVVMSWYLNGHDIGSAYGAAGSLVAILLWIYYAAMIFYFGAEFTQVRMRERGERVQPEPGAARVINHVQHVDAKPANEEGNETSAS